MEELTNIINAELVKNSGGIDVGTIANDPNIMP
jgi:hypothetical protein